MNNTDMVKNRIPENEEDREMLVSDGFKKLCCAMIASAYHDNDESFLKSSYCETINYVATGGMHLPPLEEVRKRWNEERLRAINSSVSSGNKITSELGDEMRELRKNGMTIDNISKKFRCAKSTVISHLNGDFEFT